MSLRSDAKGGKCGKAIAEKELIKIVRREWE